MTTITKQQLLNVKDLSTMLHVSQRHIWRMKAEGKLPKFVKIGGCVRWVPSDIEAWIELVCPSQKQFESHKSARRKRK